MKRLFYGFFIMLSLVAFYACSYNNNVTETTIDYNKQIKPDTVLNFKTFYTGTADTITYYSLRENKQIDSTEVNSDNWDIAFNRTNIFVNCGNRGPGHGGAFVYNNIDFGNITEVPADSSFNIETEATKAIPTGGKGWYSYDYDKMEINTIPGRVLIIRTADGKYVKLQILGYYKGYPNDIPDDIYLREERYYSFRFTYQPNGTKSFLK
jgi:hypothetical protein